MGLTNMKKLSLGEEVHFPDELSSTFLELLLPCCPNLHTFFFYYLCSQPHMKQLDPDWWIRVLASNKKLKRISLELSVNGVRNALGEEIIQKFRFLPFFAQLRVNVTYNIKRIEFPHMVHIYSIKN